MPNYVQILVTNFSGKEWSINGDSYEGLEWRDASPKPTQAELDALWQSTQETVAKKASIEKAKSLLSKSDWSVLPDVGLSNQSAFVAYRATLRELIINPVADAEFPTEPQPVWNV